MPKKDYYQILGLERNATQDEVKKAYRKMAMQHHPDRNPGNKAAEERFKEAAEAYEVLGDEDKRRRYDQFGHEGIRGTDFRPFTDVNDIFSTFSDIFGGGSIFDEMFGAAQQRQRRSGSGSMPGSDLKVRLKLSLEEISTGVEKKLKIKKWKTCETCGGSGARSTQSTVTCPVCNGAGEIRQVSRSVFGQFVNITACQNCGGEGRVIKEPCLECKGDGRIQGDTTIKVNIPAGVSEGNYIPLRGAGNVGRRGGAAGDIIVVIEEEQHTVFERNGDDVLVNLWISFPEAALGTEIEVPTLSGRSKLKIDPGTQSGRLLRMRDKGIPKLNAFGRGDQIVRIQVFVPESLTSQEKTLLKQLSQSRNITPGGGEENKEDGILARVKKVFSS